MKSAIYNGIKNVEIKEVSVPECGENDILLKNIYAGVCGTDIGAYYHGGESVRINIGSEFGHEMVSKVVEVGKNVENVKEGDIVYPYPLTCKGDSRRSATVGGFSEYVLVPDCKLNYSIYQVSDKISLKVAGMIEPFTVGSRAALSSKPQKGENVIVFGAGIIGSSSAIVLKHLGLNVMVVDFSDFRLNKMKALGFEICNSQKENLKEKAEQIFGTAYNLDGITANVDIFIDAVGSSSIINTWQELGKFKSRLVVVGIHHQPASIDWIKLTYTSSQIIGSGGYISDDVALVMNIMESNEFDLESLVSHEFKLNDLCLAIETANKADEAFKVLISY